MKFATSITFALMFACVVHFAEANEEENKEVDCDRENEELRNHTIKLACEGKLANFSDCAPRRTEIETIEECIERLLKECKERCAQRWVGWKCGSHGSWGNETYKWNGWNGTHENWGKNQTQWLDGQRNGSNETNDTWGNNNRNGFRARGNRYNATNESWKENQKPWWCRCNYGSHRSWGYKPHTRHGWYNGTKGTRGNNHRYRWGGWNNETNGIWGNNQANWWGGWNNETNGIWGNNQTNPWKGWFNGSYQTNETWGIQPHTWNVWNGTNENWWGNRTQGWDGWNGTSGNWGENQTKWWDVSDGTNGTWGNSHINWGDGGNRTNEYWKKLQKDWWENWNKTCEKMKKHQKCCSNVTEFVMQDLAKQGKPLNKTCMEMTKPWSQSQQAWGGKLPNRKRLHVKQPQSNQNNGNQQQRK